MGSHRQPKPQKVAAVAAAPKQSALDVQLAQAEAQMRDRKKRGYQSTIYAGANNEVTGAEVLG